MDSLSQLALGAACSVAVMGRRTAVWKAALWGGIAGTLPDLDALVDLGDAVRIIVGDNGGGLPPGFDPTQQTSSLGLHIVHTLVTDDLKGTLSMHSVWPDNAADGSIAAPVGAQAVVTFPKRSLPAE